MDSGARAHLLDPAAAEFHPAGPGRFPVVAYHQLYYPYPHPPPPPAAAVAFPVTPAAATRSVVLSTVPRHVGEAEVRAAMEAFGEVQAVDMEELASEGVVTVHFYDLRSAQGAVASVRQQHATRQQQAGGGLVYVLPAAHGNWVSLWGWLGGGVVGRGLTAGPAVWAQFAAAPLDEPNQGSILVLNSDPTVSCAALGQIFGAYGAVKEVRVVPSKQQNHKLVEFFDKRDAACALSELNGKEIHGRRLVLQFRATPRQTRSIYATKNNSTHYKLPLPPRLLRGSPKASRWIQNSGSTIPKLLSSSSSSGGEFCEVGKPVVLLKSSSVGNGHFSMSDVEKRSRRVSGCSKNDHPSPSSTSSLPSSKHRTSGIRGWKNHTKKEGDSRFLFKEGKPDESRPSSCRDSRTTVMIRNIPNKYSRKLLLNMLDNHCIRCNEQIGHEDDEPYSAYDFVYLPIDFNNKCNVGYGFVNLTSPEAALRFYEAFHQQPWEVFNSRKICQITYARLQGLEALMEHFRNSNFACDDEEYMPVVFSPPRDGKLLADPVTVAGGRETTAAAGTPGQNIAADEALEAPADDGCGTSSMTTSTNALSDHGDGGDDNNENVFGGGGSGKGRTGNGLGEALLKLSFK